MILTNKQKRYIIRSIETEISNYYSDEYIEYKDQLRELIEIIYKAKEIKVK